MADEYHTISLRLCACETDLVWVGRDVGGHSAGGVGSAAAADVPVLPPIAARWRDGSHVKPCKA